MALLETIRVSMFGGFTISTEDGAQAIEQNRNNKAMYLLQYLLVNREKGATRDSLIELLYEEEDIDNPGNALKIIIHRMRKLLANAGLPDYDYICYRRGVYFWNNEIPTVIDTEEFEKAFQQASGPDIDDDARIAGYTRAVELYKGDFLPRMAIESWVSILAVRYQKMYIQAINELYRLLSERKDYQTLLAICNRAAKIDLYNEDVQVLRISCLFELKRFKEALAAYDAVTSMFFNELNVSPGEKMIALYKKMREAAQFPWAILDDIKSDLQEAGDESGAFYCNYLTFIDSYRFVMRIIERTGQSVFLMSVTVTDAAGVALTAGPRMQEVVDGLHEAIRLALRRGDLYTRYSASQFLTLLIGISQENCDIVSQRIDKVFQERYHGRGVRLQYKITPANTAAIADGRVSFSPTVSW
ncbi:MAG: BTAD domain-containing putative transcriptional regulator [Bacillota bacterium]|nr:BTAD domain-containing putative transcriptional regulator [Bacillota bacterium]